MGAAAVEVSTDFPEKERPVAVALGEVALVGPWRFPVRVLTELMALEVAVAVDRTPMTDPLLL
jgi:hypothetical protein